MGTGTQRHSVSRCFYCSKCFRKSVVKGRICIWCGRKGVRVCEFCLGLQSVCITSESIRRISMHNYSPLQSRQHTGLRGNKTARWRNQRDSRNEFGQLVGPSPSVKVGRCDTQERRILPVKSRGNCAFSLSAWQQFVADRRGVWMLLVQTGPC